jgi:thioredoxin 1
MANADVIELSDDNFETEILRSEKPALVDFWAVWCGPCRMLGPTIEKVANDFVGKVKVVKLNTEDAPEIAAKYRISAIPQIMVFKGSEQPVERPSPGLKSEADIVKMLNRVLGG